MKGVFDMKMLKRLKKAAKAFKGLIQTDKPIVALTLGSGLGDITKEIESSKSLPYEKIPGFPTPKKKVKGHGGRFVIGFLRGVQVIAMEGRQHSYEGVSLDETVFGTRLMILLGAKILIPTNAVGAATRNLAPGEFVVGRDHIGSHDRSPLTGENEEELGKRFPDMTTPYDAALIALAMRCALEQRVSLHRGTLFYHAGPQYETPAEVEEARRRGGDILTMSTVPEVIAAQHMGARVLTISSVVNMGSGLLNTPLSHEDVLASAKKSAPQFIRLLTAIIEEIGVLLRKTTKKKSSRKSKRK